MSTDHIADNTDKKLLLAFQSACNEAGTPLPWKIIERHLGIGASDGAIIQHLTKIRIKMVNAGLPVPPALKRGGAGSRANASRRDINNPGANISIYTRAQRAHATNDDDGDEITDAENGEPFDDYSPTKSVAKKARTLKRGRRDITKIKSEDLSDKESSEKSSSLGGRVAAGSKFLKFDQKKPTSVKSESSTQSSVTVDEKKVLTLRYANLPKVDAVMQQYAQDVQDEDEDVESKDQQTMQYAGNENIFRGYASNNGMTGYGSSDVGYIGPMTYDTDNAAYLPSVGICGLSNTMGSTFIDPLACTTSHYSTMNGLQNVGTPLPSIETPTYGNQLTGFPTQFDGFSTAWDQPQTPVPAYNNMPGMFGSGFQFGDNGMNNGMSVHRVEIDWSRFCLKRKLKLTLRLLTGLGSQYTPFSTSPDAKF